MSTLLDFSEAIALIMKQPRTVRDLQDTMGFEDRDKAYRWVSVLHDQGLIYIGSWRRTAGRPLPVWHWQPAVCQFDDVPAPSPVRRSVKSRAEPKVHVPKVDVATEARKRAGFARGVMACGAK